MIRLDRCDGPECPRCGCRDSEILKDPAGGRSWWDAGRARCNHCRLEFAFQELPQPAQAVEHELDQFPAHVQIAESTFQPQASIPPPAAICPACGGRLMVKSSHAKVRYCKCEACGKNVKLPRASA